MADGFCICDHRVSEHDGKNGCTQCSCKRWWDKLFERPKVYVSALQYDQLVQLCPSLRPYLVKAESL